MLKTETKKSKTKQQGENAPAAKKTKWKNAVNKAGGSKHIRNVRVGADGKKEPAIEYMDHAPIHPVYLHADGLFRPVPYGQTNQTLQVKKTYKQANQIVLCEWSSKEALNIVDQSVLLFLCQIAAPKGRSFEVSSAKTQSEVLTKSLNATGVGSIATCLGIKTTLPEVARGIGLTATGTNTKAILESLNRLAATRMRRTFLNSDGSSSTKTGETNVLGLVCNDDSHDVVFNAELSRACKRGDSVTWVNMREHRSIKSKPAKRLHAWLSNWASSRKTQVIGLKKLTTHIWGDHPCTVRAEGYRVQTLRTAIREIGNLAGWVCRVEEGKQQLIARKPVFAGTQAITAVTPQNIAVTLTKSAETLTSTSPEASTGVALRLV